MQNTKTSGFFYRMLCGFFLGLSVIAPGVSGSVIAVMMGIYRDLINVISNPFKGFKRNVFYLLPMAIGAVISIVLGILLLSALFDNYPIQARMLFFALVLGGLPAMLKEANGNGESGFKLRYLIAMLIAFAIAGGVGLFARLSGGNMPGDTFALPFLCLAGAVSGACSMMPGMSVSMILMLFGVYEYLMDSASTLTKSIFVTWFSSENVALILMIAAIVISFLIGMVLFSKLTKLVFARHERLAYYMVFGFMCGTLTAIIPSEMPSSAGGWIGLVIAVLAGVLISALFQILGKKFGSAKTEDPASQEN